MAWIFLILALLFHTPGDAGQANHHVSPIHVLDTAGGLPGG